MAMRKPEHNLSPKIEVNGGKKTNPQNYKSIYSFWKWVKEYTLEKCLFSKKSDCPLAPLSRPHFLSHTRTQDTLSPSPRARARSPRLPLSLSLWPTLQPFKMLPLPCDSPAAAPRPPARSPAPSLARFLSLALPLPTSDLLH